MSKRYPAETLRVWIMKALKQHPAPCVHLRRLLPRDRRLDRGELEDTALVSKAPNKTIWRRDHYGPPVIHHSDARSPGGL